MRRGRQVKRGERPAGLLGHPLPPQSRHRESRQLPSDQSKTRSKTPTPSSEGTGLPRGGPPRPPSPAGRPAPPAAPPPPPHLPLGGQVGAHRGVGLCTEDRVHAARLPPRPGLHPLRDHGGDLPEPSLPQELLRTLDRSSCSAHPAPTHVHGIVVPPHVSPFRALRALVVRLDPVP